MATRESAVSCGVNIFIDYRAAKGNGRIREGLARKDQRLFIAKSSQVKSNVRVCVSPEGDRCVMKGAVV